MALDTFVAGRYSATYNLVDVGITREGYRLQIESRWEEIGETDAYGETLIDGIYRGGRAFLMYDSKAYKPGSVAPFWPWGGTVAAPGVLGTVVNPGAINTPIGVLASDFAKAMVLTATAGTPAAAAPATLTGSKSILAPNNPADLLFTSKLREVPTRLALLAFDAGAGVIKHFITT